MGGKPNPATKPDKRLKENQLGRRAKPQSKAVPQPERPKGGKSK